MGRVFALIGRLVGHPYFSLFMSVAMLTIGFVRLTDTFMEKGIRHDVTAEHALIILGVERMIISVDRLRTSVDYVKKAARK